MEKDLLGKVVETEQEIQKKLDEEKERCRAWLDEVRLECEKARRLASEESGLLLKERDATREREIRARADALLASAQARAAAMETLSDDSIRRLATAYLHLILSAP